jgi:hypothetical protein
VSRANALTSDELEHSQWSTSYEALGGGSVNADLVFNGDTGSYAGGRGELWNVQYTVNLGGGATIKGNWGMSGTSGSFTFFVAGNSNPPVFSGAWQSSGRSGNWRGRFVQVVQQGRGGVTFGRWQRDPVRDRYWCRYQYPDKNNPNRRNEQIMVWYPDDGTRNGYYYFVNAKNQYWGRCICPANPGYNPNVMQWSLLTDGQWEDLPPGDCPSPKDGDPQGAAIGSIPDPPA